MEPLPFAQTSGTKQVSHNAVKLGNMEWTAKNKSQGKETKEIYYFQGDCHQYLMWLRQISTGQKHILLNKWGNSKANFPWLLHIHFLEFVSVLNHFLSCLSLFEICMLLTVLLVELKWFVSQLGLKQEFSSLSSAPAHTYSGRDEFMHASPSRLISEPPWEGDLWSLMLWSPPPPLLFNSSWRALCVPLSKPLEILAAKDTTVGSKKRS